MLARMAQPTTHAELPQYPRLVPGLDVLLRKPDEIQFGLDPRHAVVASGLPPSLVDTLRTLDGLISTTTALSTAGPEHAERLRGVLGELARRGLVEEARPHAAQLRASGEPEHSSLRAGKHARQGRSDSTVLIYGGGRGAVATAAMLATAGVGRLDSRCSGRVGNPDLGTGYVAADIGMPRRQAMLAAIHRANPRTDTTKLVGKEQPTLAVLADMIVPDPDLTLELSQKGIPHLPIRVRDGIGIVGPLVIPGKTSCLRCADLHRADLDPCWPTVATQLAGRSRPAELSSVHALAALAAGQVLRALNPADRAPNTWDATLEIDPYEGELYRRQWAAHPDCPCDAFHGYY